MSFLQTNKWSRLKKRTMPSPTCEKMDSDQQSRKKNIIPKLSVRRMSLFPSFVGNSWLKASMTVEASMLLPLFMFFFLHLMGVVEMLRIHSKLSFAMWNAGKQLAVYEAVADSVGVEVPDIAVSYLYVQGSVQKLLGKDYLNTSPLVYGSAGLNYLASDYDEDYVDIGITYEVKPKVTIFPFRYMRLANRFYGKVWSGYDVSEDELRYVYVTLYGEAWHEILECSYLDIEVKECEKGVIGMLRNNSGGKYRLCELCDDEEEGLKVYYTPYGDCYHKDRECSSLVRYIRAIVWQENLPYRACTRCVEE